MRIYIYTCIYIYIYMYIYIYAYTYINCCFERLDDALVLLVSLTFLYPQKILISVR